MFMSNKKRTSSHLVLSNGKGTVKPQGINPPIISNAIIIYHAVSRVNYFINKKTRHYFNIAPCSRGLMRNGLAFL